MPWGTDTDSGVASALMDMYKSMGDALALQYGGSAAHNTRVGKWKASTLSREFLKSIKRYYSNTDTDGEKWDAINSSFGHFQPQGGKHALWDLDSDYYLHLGALLMNHEKKLTGSMEGIANTESVDLSDAPIIDEGSQEYATTSKTDDVEAAMVASVKEYEESGSDVSSIMPGGGPSGV